MLQLDQMKKPAFFLFAFLAILTLLAHSSMTLRAEDKSPSGQMIPKLPQTPNDPILLNAHVYPFWGPICQRYTYSVVYQDKEGRAPEYVQIYFNGDWLDIEKENPENNDYQKGVKYSYQFVPKKIGSNFYFFEASNGLGKTRAGIIDSPDNGPVLFESAFNNNEIALINAASGQKVWSYPTGKEWVGGVALSDDGKYLTVQTSNHVYLFETNSAKPQWVYTATLNEPIGGDVKGGIDLSADGSLIFALLGNQALLFDKNSNQPLWQAPVSNGGYNAAISANGEYMSVATAGTETDKNTNLLILWHKDSPKRLWQYHSSGNFHDVSFSSDGNHLAAATGCPDRRGYLFSKNSNEPLWRSKMLTRDSPIHQAKISSDGLMAAFGAESEDGAIHLYSKEANEILWKFSTPGQHSFRAVSITPDGKFIGGATTVGGQAVILDKVSPTPLASWQINASLGAADLADDGSFLAVGGTDNQVHLLEKKSQKEKASVALNEFVGEIDISADGRFVAAGTSGSVYFFESLDSNQPEAECKTIVEPKPEGTFSDDGEGDGQPKPTYCGDNVCEGPETSENCPRDCDPSLMNGKKESLSTENKKSKWLVVFGLVSLAGFLCLGGYFAVTKLKFSKKPPFVHKKIAEKEEP